MTRSHRSLVLPLALAAALGVSACGAEADPAADDAATTEEIAADTAEQAAEVPAVEDDDHDDDDEDHEDHDDDDDHDGDEDHEDHEDHDDHDGDKDHDDYDDHAGGLGAHEHGTAELSVAWIGTEVAIDLISPTFNVFGFEYEPTTDDDIAIEADRTEVISDAGIMAINSEAGCTLVEPAETEVEREGSHSEITVSWVFSCENPDAIEQIDASELFAAFPNFEDVDAQWISESDQSADELTPASTTLSLRT